MESIKTSDELRLANRARILGVLRSHGKMARKHIGELTSLSAATVTLVTAELIEEGLIAELPAQAPQALAPQAKASGSHSPAPSPDQTGSQSPPPRARRGRPQVLLDLLPGAGTIVVVSVLLNRVEAHLYDYCGNTITQVEKTVKTAGLTHKTLLSTLCGVLDQCLENKAHARALKTISLVCQGTVSSESGSMLWSPIFALTNVALCEPLSKRYGVNTTIQNDCNMIATALNDQQVLSQLSHASSTESDVSTAAASRGRDKVDFSPVTNADHDDFAAVLISYGIGLGVVHRGGIVSGSRSSGTELGHMIHQADGALCRCGRRGCIEAYAAEYAIWRHATGKSPDSAPSDKIQRREFQQIIDRAMQHDGIERQAFAQAGTAIGQGLASLFAIFDPFHIILVGNQFDYLRLLQPTMSQALTHFVGDSAADYIALYDNLPDAELVRLGALKDGVSRVDKHVFGFGEQSEAGVYAG